MTTRPLAHPFSPAGRDETLQSLTESTLDLLIVGGGITGCGVARDAALRGWSVGLVEKEDFAFGTSSRSSKIVHGGVRYLEYGHFLLVRESARERIAVRTIAPHLVHRLDFLYPVFAPDSLVKIKAGLSVFDWLAGASGDDKHDNLDPEETRALLPGLREPLRGSVRYPEYITDDARLTLENALSAAEHGARVVNRAKVERFLLEDGSVVGAQVTDIETGRTIEVRARCVVNAAGPWAEAVLLAAGLEPERPLRPSKGIHLLLSADRLPIQGATFLKSATGRRGLAMRRLDHVYVGTSDDEYTGPLDTPRATRAEVLDLLAMVQDCFPDAGLTVDDVLATWAGIRPLIAEEGKSTRDTSREDEVWQTPPGLVTVAGGKLTTYRRMAERVLDEVRDVLGRAPRDEDRTEDVPLPGAPPGDCDAFLADRAETLSAAGVPPATIRRLTWLYGRALDRLIEWGHADATWLLPLAEGIPAVRGEVRLAVQEEMAGRLIDFMDRRSALMLFSEDLGRAAAEPAARIMGQYLDWDESRVQSEVAGYMAYATEHEVPAE